MKELGAFYLAINIFALLTGLLFVNDLDSSCYKPKRISYVFPAYHLGCYLGGVPSEKK